MEASPAIDVRELRVSRGGREVIHGLSCQVPSGAITGLLGPSGCGKSTLMRSIVGVQVVAAGEVWVLGEAAGSPGLRRRVGYVTQAPSVYNDLSVRENLEFFARVIGAPRTRVGEVLEVVSLLENVERRVDGLSEGQRSRVSLATALLGEPDLLVLDEPTVGLDPVLRVELWGTFAQLAAEGRTLLVSSHVIEEAGHCASLLLMRDGELLASETPEGLLRRTRTRSLDEAFLALIEAEAR